jgi:hypothetical protein
MRRRPQLEHDDAHQLTEANLEIENHNLRFPRFQGMATRLGRPFESVLRP